MMNERRPALIAVVDDDADSRLLTAAVLTSAGHQAVTDDGATGLAERLAMARPDLILLDLHLDGRDGDEALREIRTNSGLRDVPVVGLTGAIADDPVLERLAPMLAGCVTKPLVPGDLVRTIDQRLEARAGGVDEIDAIRRRFLDGLADRIARIEVAMASGEPDALVLEVHRLRGAAAGFGYAGVAAAATAAEQALRSGDAKANETVEKLIEEARRVQKAKS